jgi:protein-tyrosine phosphatase
MQVNVGSGTARERVVRRVLIVCTANVCRSPVAEQLLRRHLAAAGRDAVVASAGTHGGRLEVHPDTVAAARRLGLDLRRHVSRPLSPRLLAEDGTDLVIGMARTHVRAAVAMEGATWSRAFTLREIVRRSRAVDGDLGFDRWRDVVAAGRRAADLVGDDPAEDVADPYGLPRAAHVEMVRDLDELTAELAGRFPIEAPRSDDAR